MPDTANGWAEHAWQNPHVTEDVNNDRFVSPADVLLLINHFNAKGSYTLPADRTESAPFWDVSGDNAFTPLDFLIIVNYLNRSTENKVIEAVSAYESFTYEPQERPLIGSGSGCGFADDWSIGGFNASVHANYEIVTEGLSFPGLATTGNSIATKAQTKISGVARTLDRLSVTGDTVYLSFLIQPRGTLNAGSFNGFFGVYLDSQHADYPDDLFVGKSGAGALDRYVIENRGGASQVASDLPVEVDETAFLVLRVELLDGNDRFTLYTNPVPGDPEPARNADKEDFDLGQLGAIVLYATGSFAIDELRVGSSFAAVTPLSASR